MKRTLWRTLIVLALTVNFLAVLPASAALPTPDDKPVRSHQLAHLAHKPTITPIQLMNPTRMKPPKCFNGSAC